MATEAVTLCSSFGSSMRRMLSAAVTAPDGGPGPGVTTAEGGGHEGAEA
ncbi:hypothetical protein GCM10010478_56500 [Streptomyces erythrogriseus]|uniref:Uncharacterized protein n=1 Tax=Streptomyces erythrogriseus TaxID=284027 RepID=A0ABN3XEA2_9ACTN